MKKISSILVLASLAGCIPKVVNTKKVTTSSIVGKSINAIGTDSGTGLPTIPNTDADTVIEFKNTAEGNMVCKYPSGVCRTDADESSGGASAYGNIPNSSGSFIHYMKFRFYSSGFFAKNPDAHIAFGLRGQRLRVEEFGANAGVDGRGMIIGNIGYGYAYNKNNIACVDRMAQVESYFRTSQTSKKTPNGNLIVPTTCSDTIFEDYKWYSVELEVTSHQYIIYKVYNNNNQLIYKSYYNDQPNYIDPNLTGWFIGHVFGDPKGLWSLKLENFEVGHVISGDPFYPVKNFTPPLSFSSKYGVAQEPSAHDFSVVFNKSIPSQIKLNNIFNRTRLFGCANHRPNKTGVDSVDCSKAENYRTMTFSTETDWVFSGTTLSLKESFIKSVPAGFYTLYFRQNPQDSLSQVSLSMELRE